MQDRVEEYVVGRAFNVSTRAGSGPTLWEFLFGAVLPSLAGTAIGMFEPFRRGHPVPSYKMITRNDWWLHVFVTFVAYAVIAFFVVHIVYRNQASVHYADFVQYGIAALTGVGYICARTALGAYEIGN